MASPAYWSPVTADSVRRRERILDSLAEQFLTVQREVNTAHYQLLQWLATFNNFCVIIFGPNVYLGLTPLE